MPASRSELRHRGTNLHRHLRLVRERTRGRAEQERRIPDTRHQPEARHPPRATLPILVRDVPLGTPIPDIALVGIVESMCHVRERLNEPTCQSSPPLHLGGQPTPGAELLVRHVRLNRRARRLIQNLVLVHQRRRTAAERSRQRGPGTELRHRDRATRRTAEEGEHLVRRRAQEPLLFELCLLGRDRILVLTLRTEPRPVTRLMLDHGLDFALHRVQVTTSLRLIRLAPNLIGERDIRQDLCRIRTVVLLVQVSLPLTVLVDVAGLRRPTPSIRCTVVRHNPGEVMALIQSVQVVAGRLLLHLIEERVIERSVVAVLRRAPLPASWPSWCAPLLSERVISPGECLPRGKLPCGCPRVPPRAGCAAPRGVFRSTLLLLIQSSGTKAASRRPSVPPSGTSTHMNSSERRWQSLRQMLPHDRSDAYYPTPEHLHPCDTVVQSFQV